MSKFGAFVMGRQLNLLDEAIGIIDKTLRTLVKPTHRPCGRANPAHQLPESSLTPQEKQHIAGLMRVNHAGEVSAQALYQGQALTAKLTSVKEQMTQAAAEEVDHLAWCEDRLRELNSKTSLLNPIWYTGSLLIGALAGLIGDRFSLGFVAETEHQVSHHLQKHLQHLPTTDLKTKAIITQMQTDESHHAEIAKAAGAADLPFLVKRLMQSVSKLMTTTSYYI